MKTTNTETVRHTIYSDPVLTKPNPNDEVRKPGPVSILIFKFLFC